MAAYIQPKRCLLVDKEHTTKKRLKLYTRTTMWIWISEMKNKTIGHIYEPFGSAETETDEKGIQIKKQSKVN